MLFSELIKSDLLKVPFNQNEDLTFNKYVDLKLSDYLNLLEKLDFSDIKIPGIKPTKDTIIRRQNEFVSGLKNAISLYYKGYPEASYNSLKKTIESRIKNYSTYSQLLKIDSYDRSTNFDRIRVLNENKQPIPEQFFHIPFEHRGKVTSQRFSIPGFPSLYLGTSVYICWEELNRPNINEFHSIRFKSKSSIKFIDLAPPYFEDNLYQARYYKYLMTWPLIFLCSIRVKNINDIFKPEYIVPQLLLQWIRGNKEIDGIRYWSTHVEKNPTNFKGEFYNLILPVKKEKDYGLCNSLCEMFRATEVVSWQLYELAFSGFDIFNSRDFFAEMDSKTECLELIKGIEHSYSDSAFGIIEACLLNLKTKKIESAVKLT